MKIRECLKILLLVFIFLGCVKEIPTNVDQPIQDSRIMIPEYTTEFCSRMKKESIVEYILYGNADNPFDDSIFVRPVMIIKDRQRNEVLIKMTGNLVENSSNHIIVSYLKNSPIVIGLAPKESRNYIVIDSLDYLPYSYPPQVKGRATWVRDMRRN